MAAVAEIVWDEWAASCQDQTLEINILLLSLSLSLRFNVVKTSADHRCYRVWYFVMNQASVWVEGRRCWGSSLAGLLSSDTSLNIYFSFTGSTQIEGGDVNQTPLIDSLDRPGLPGPVSRVECLPSLAAVQKRMNGSDLRGKKNRQISFSAGRSSECCLAKFSHTWRGFLGHKAINCGCCCDGANWDELLT